MTEDKRPPNPWTDPTQLPRPDNYTATASLGPCNYPGTGRLTCTTCSQVIREDLVAEDLTDPAKYLENSVRKHNRGAHPELLYIFTSAGWLSAGMLGLNDLLRSLHS